LFVPGSLGLVFCFDRTELMVNTPPTHPQTTKAKAPETDSHSQTAHNHKSHSAASKAPKGASKRRTKTGQNFRVSFKEFNDSKGTAYKTFPARNRTTYGERRACLYKHREHIISEHNPHAAAMREPSGIGQNLGIKPNFGSLELWNLAVDRF
jgi:hypothetical protein